MSSILPSPVSTDPDGPLSTRTRRVRGNVIPASERPLDELGETLGWSALVKAVDLHVTPGYHLTTIEKAGHAADLAETLAQLITSLPAAAVASTPVSEAS